MRIKEFVTTLFNSLERHFPFLIYGLLFVVMGIKVAGLRLLIDDYDHIWTALIGNYAQHFSSLIYSYGLWRPLAFIFFYLIYTVYLTSPVFVHLFTLFLHFAGGYLLQKILAKYVSKNQSLLISLIYIVFPFFTEQYGWLAAANATVANLVLLLQIYILGKGTLSINKKIVLLTVLQTTGMFLYESIFFTFVPLIYFIYKESYQIKLSLREISKLGMLAAPSLLYFALRNLIFVPHNLDTIRDLGAADFFSGKFAGVLLANVLKITNDVSFLFLSEGVWSAFWIHGLIDGLKNIVANPLAFLLINYFGLALLLHLYLYKNESFGQSQKRETLTTPSFWLMIGFFSLLPSLLLVEPSYPFRVLALPLFTFLVAGLFLVKDRWQRYFVPLSIAVFILFFALTFHMLGEMAEQAKDDERLLSQIVELLDKNVAESEQVQLVIRNMPYKTRTIFNYGEYLSSCPSVTWCLLPAMSRRTNKVSDVVINPDETFVPQENSLVLIYQAEHNKFEQEGVE